MKVNIAIARAIAVVVAGSSLMLSPPVAAAAPDLVGQTYADAAAAIAKLGSTAVVASRLGSRLPLSECKVTNVSRPTPLRTNHEVVPGQAGQLRRPRHRYRIVEPEYRLTLNCNDSVSSAKTPRNSAAR